MAEQRERILVIKHGALGDFLMALAAMQAIRRHHAPARVTLLTTPAMEPLARASGLFDEIWFDKRAPLWRPDLWLPLLRRLRRGGFRRVYDLQRSGRSGRYFQALWPRQPEWVGVVPGASHRYRDPPRPTHIMARHREMLAAAGVEVPAYPDLSFLDEPPPEGLLDGLAGRLALLVPGCSPERPEKRWPAERYGALAHRLQEAGLSVVLIGTRAEAEAIEEIRRLAPDARHAPTSLAQLAALARRATLAVSNDTGPAHLIAAAGCPLLVLYPGSSDPVRLLPPGPRVAHLRRERLADLPLEEVERAALALGETA